MSDRERLEAVSEAKTTLQALGWLELPGGLYFNPASSDYIYLFEWMEERGYDMSFQVQVQGPGGVQIGGEIPTSFGGGQISEGTLKEQATAIVDYAEAAMIRVRDDYLGEPNRTRTMQQTALADYDRWWAWMVESLSDPGLGRYGSTAVSERSPGGRWPYQVWYRDPIAQDAGVQDDITGTIGGALDGLGDLIGAGGGISGWTVALVIGGALLAKKIFF